MSLRWRIILPFFILFAGAFLVLAFVSVHLVERTVERRFEAQAKDLARLMSSPRGFPLNAGALEYIKEAYGADIVVARDGAVSEGLSTLPPGASIPKPREGVVRAPLGTRELVLIFPEEVVARERADAVRPIVEIAGAGLVAVILIGVFVTFFIARPIERLARAAETGAAPDVGGGPEMAKLVAALNRMTETIRRGERLAVMGQTAAGVAHEIRNPLAAMKMTVQMLAEGKAAKEREPYDLVLREIERLELATSELMSAASPKLAKEKTALNGIVDDVLSLLERQLAHLSVSVERRYAASMEAAVDPSRYKRAVLNLILNGAQAMPGGGKLVVGLAPSDGRARFSVTDGGKGVPAELRDRIFEPFVTGREDGIGLGLALTKRIAEDHGGAIGYETSPSGSTFWMDVPLS